ncbi:MAG: chromosomal replication initiator protein DnaA [Rhodothermales bacterium]|nr:chromosomal replication initiator protein DnaA [Rhodothermales bacterium]
MNDAQEPHRLVDTDASPAAVWKACLAIIQDNVTGQSYKTWFEPLKAVGLKEEEGQLKLTVQLPSRFYYEWLEEHYFSLLRKTVTKVLGPTGRLFYEIVIEKEQEGQHLGSSMQVPARPPAPESQPQAQPPRPPAQSDTDGGAATPPRTYPSQPSGYHPVGGSTNASQRGPIANPFAIPGIQKVRVDSQLNPAYVFERFIEGDCNRLARSASWAIAQQPGATSFNPFLIYGGVGLGKTHLIQAVGNYVSEHHKNETVLYVSSERFTTQFVQAIQNNRASEFSLFYRQIDLLIVDDVQFFGGKEKTQEEFFHIFNALHQAGKQIILSADRPPKDIEGIEERLLSRFSWGLSADVQQPELETRIAILQRKAEDDGIDVDPDVIEFIAHNVKSNIRELEGSLIRLLAHATLHGREIDLDLAKEVLRDLIKEARVQLGTEQIQKLVCDYFSIPEDLVRARTRKREVVQARQVAMYFTKQLTKQSLKSIGLQFGGRDHSTVIHAIQTVEDQIDTDPQFREVIEEIRRKIELHTR